MLAQGGRLVTERRMVADLYEFDLATFVWARVPPHPDDAAPGARYFHSTDACESAVLLYHYYFFRFCRTLGRPTIRSLGMGRGGPARETRRRERDKANVRPEQTRRSLFADVSPHYHIYFSPSSVASHHHVSLLPDFTFYYSFCYQSLSFLCFATPYRSATPSYLCVARPV